MNKFTWMKAFFSPFKRPKIYLYIGKIALGTPYFFPRKWVKFTYEDAFEAAVKDTQSKTHYNKGKNPLDLVDGYMGYQKAIPRKIGWDFVGLGWKTKYDSYRHEWDPIWSFVFFKWQIAIRFIPKESCHYWECWLGYELGTDKTKNRKERIKECREKYPQIWECSFLGKKETIDFYTKVLKFKYLKQNKLPQ